MDNFRKTKIKKHLEKIKEIASGPEATAEEKRTWSNICNLLKEYADTDKREIVAAKTLRGTVVADYDAMKCIEEFARETYYTIKKQSWIDTEYVEEAKEFSNAVYEAIAAHDRALDEEEKLI